MRELVMRGVEPPAVSKVLLRMSCEELVVTEEVGGRVKATTEVEG